MSFSTSTRKAGGLMPLFSADMPSVSEKPDMVFEAERQVYA